MALDELSLPSGNQSCLRSEIALTILLAVKTSRSSKKECINY